MVINEVQSQLVNVISSIHIMLSICWAGTHLYKNNFVFICTSIVLIIAVGKVKYSITSAGHHLTCATHY